MAKKKVMSDAAKLEYDMRTQNARQMSLDEVAPANVVIYGYCRISTKDQSLERQERNIKAAYPSATIIKETYSGRTLDRPNWNKLLENITKDNGDLAQGKKVTIVFDSVSRMSRDAEEGFKLYKDLFEKGVNLIFLKESHINTAAYEEARSRSIEKVGNEIADLFIVALNSAFECLAENQIREAFKQSNKEVADLRQRTREGLVTAKMNGKQVGNKKGVKLETEKSRVLKPLIKKYHKDFNGSLNDKETIKQLGISRNTFYKYKKELLSKSS